MNLTENVRYTIEVLNPIYVPLSFFAGGVFPDLCHVVWLSLFKVVWRTEGLYNKLCEHSLATQCSKSTVLNCIWLTSV